MKQTYSSTILVAHSQIEIKVLLIAVEIYSGCSLSGRVLICSQSSSILGVLLGVGEGVLHGM